MLDLTSFSRIVKNDIGQKIAAKFKNDPTAFPPPAYNLENAQRVYGGAFRQAFEFLIMNFIDGDIAEFGTYRGYTASVIAKLIKETALKTHLHLFDSFDGLPELNSVDSQSYEGGHTKVWYRGQTTYSQPELIAKALKKIIHADQLSMHKGFFEDTLHADTLNRPLCLVHIDCDLYQSTICVLARLFEYERIQDGAVILFDDWNCGRANPGLGERRAFQEVMDKYSTKFSYSHYFNYGWHGAAFIIHKHLSIDTDGKNTQS